ncbi:MAG TPA: hypothetical protein VIV40_33895 [Kofleriaceae bacterium]
MLSGAAGAHGFAQAPTEEARVAMPMRVAPDRAEVRKALEQRRAKNLAAFRKYRRAGVYPHNTVRPGPLNVWRDADGHLCAAATLIWNDGKHDLVDQTADSDNQIRLMNVTKGPLLDWIMTSGFTIEEIDMIQAPMIYPDGRVEGPWLPRDFTAEDAALKAGYARTAAYLVKHGKRDLDKAVDRLMKNPALAQQLVDGRV